MAVIPTSIAGLFVIRWPIVEDARGFFKHSYQAGELTEAIGRAPSLRQGNHSRSVAGVLRGFHSEPWDKLIYVVRGTAKCVVADVRPESATFATTESFVLGDAPGDHARLFVSKGLSNAFFCYTEADYINDVSAEFDPANRGGVAWNDPSLDVDWPTATPILSAKDAAQPSLRSLFPDHPFFAEARG
ncbi:MAG: dTDP-4-dehydrorhamnose 3,5-epimerase family protein [Phycisphaerales bacterium]|nr:dTDP-4-dehydrorhamnose 3,5-epimerase family protein [Hyphomonadaceae bacterium]